MKKLKEIFQYKRILKFSRLSLKKVLSYQTLLHAKPLIDESFYLLYIKSSYSNTILTLTNLRGRVVYSFSCGSLGFTGKKKRTTKFAIESALNNMILKIKDLGFSKVLLLVNGFTKARFYIVNSMKKNNINLVGIRDITSNPHNGCRPRKLRRG